MSGWTLLEVCIVRDTVGVCLRQLSVPGEQTTAVCVGPLSVPGEQTTAVCVGPLSVPGDVQE